MPTKQNVLVIDDEPHIRRLIAAALQRSGYNVLEAADGRAALAHLASTPPAAALVDLGLPDRDGLELVDKFARTGNIAIIVVSAREAVEEKIAALDLGADDYIAKPFDTDELLARLRAALRRKSGPVSTHLTVGPVAIDLDRHEVAKRGEIIRLTPKEFALLAELARHAGKVVTHGHLLRVVWGAAHEDDIEYLRVAARALRLKLEDDPARPTFLKNEPGIGYRIG